MRASWDDTIRINDKVSATGSQDVDTSMSDLRDNLNAPPAGFQTIYFDKTLVIPGTNANAYYDMGVNIPIGSIVRSIGLKILDTVIGGGTTVKLGIGLDPAGTVNDNVNKYSYTADFLIGTKFNNLYNVVTPITAAEDLVLTGLTSAGTAEGNTALTGGTVRVHGSYDTPVIL